MINNSRNSHAVHEYTNEFVKGYLETEGFHYIDEDENGNLIVTKNGKTFSVHTSGNTRTVIDQQTGGMDKFTSEFVILVSNVYLDMKNVDRRIFILPTTHAKHLKHSSRDKSETLHTIIDVIDYLSYEVNDHNIDELISINALNSHPIEPAWKDLKTAAVEFVRRLYKQGGCRIIDNQKDCDLIIIDNYDNRNRVDVYPSKNGFRYPPMGFMKNSTADVITIVSNGKIGIIYPSTYPSKRNGTTTVTVDSNPKRFDIDELTAMYIINHHGKSELIVGLRNGPDIEERITEIEQQQIEIEYSTYKQEQIDTEIEYETYKQKHIDIEIEYKIYKQRQIEIEYKEYRQKEKEQEIIEILETIDIKRQEMKNNRKDEERHKKILQAIKDNERMESEKNTDDMNKLLLEHFGKNKSKKNKRIEYLKKG